MRQQRKGKPPRLERIFQKYDPGLFFVTFNTHLRRDLLASVKVHSAFIDYSERACERNIGVGRYVIMPDHLHLFVCFGTGSAITLGAWVKGLKRHLDVALIETGAKPSTTRGQKLFSFWQPGFHDYLLRSDESYSEKWAYVRDNPDRAGLVLAPDDWPYAGENVIIDRI